jgi:anti-sigma B factor antagonist
MSRNMNGLTIVISAGATDTVLELVGELDYHTTPQLLEVLQALDLDPDCQLVIDLAALDFCDSTGITTLMVARNRALAADGHIALAALPDHVVRIFSLIGLDRVFTVHPTVADAIAARPGPRL